MNNEEQDNSLQDYEAWEFAHTYKRNELLSKLKEIISSIESGRIKVDVQESKEANEGPLDIEFPSEEVLCTFEYDSEPMFIEESAKKGYFGIKLFWSDLGIEKLIEEEGKLDELEEGEDMEVDEDYEEME